MQDGRGKMLRLSLVASLVIFFLAFLPSSLALRCSCNDVGVLSDCQWQGWTCTIDPSIGECFARTKVLEDGSVRRDVGCVLTAWNPTFCSSDQTTETYAVQCCGDGDLCNDDLTPTFLSLAVSSTHAPDPVPSPHSDSLRTTLSQTMVMEPSPTTSLKAPPLLLSSTEFGSSAMQTIVPSPTPLPYDMLRCECTPSQCDEEYCLTDYKCFKNVKYNRGTDTVTTLLGCYYARHRVYGSRLCNGTIDTAENKIRCCDDRDMCNSDLDVPLDRRPAADDSLMIPGTTTTTVSSVLPTGDTTTDPAVVTDGPTLIHSDILSVMGGICCSCYFTSSSTAKGCIVKLYDEYTVMLFNAYRKTNDDMGLLECFTVQQVGEFHVDVFEILRNGSERLSMIHLREVMIESAPSCGKNTEPAAHASLVVMGLSVLLGLALVVLLLTILVVCTLVMRNKRAKENKNTISTPQNDFQATSPHSVNCAPGCDEALSPACSTTAEGDQMKDTIDVGPNVAYIPITLNITSA